MRSSIKYLIAVVIVLGIFSCAGKDKKTQLAELKQKRTALDLKIEALESSLKVNVEKPLIDVSVLALKPELFVHKIEVQGKIESDRNILVPAEAAGAIVRIYVKEGDKVNKGQVMAQIDNSILLAQMKEVKGNLELAKNIFERTDRLYKQQIGSEIDYLQAKNKKESLESNLATLRAQLSKTQVLAPFTGRVDKVLMKEGEAVGSGTGMIRVVHASQLKVVVNLSEDYITSLAKGQDVFVNFPTINKTMNLKITNVSNVIDESNRTFAIEIALPSDADLYPNMYAVVTIQDYTNSKALVVPERNITAYNSKFYIYMLALDAHQKPVAEFREVEVGKSFNSQTEITKGVKEGEQYILKGFSQLSDGQGVKIVE